MRGYRTTTFRGFMPMNNLDCLSEVLEDFCTKYNLEFMSADDLLYGDSEGKLTNYQRDWLRNYISIWDIIVNY